jgi:hypothetical protein
VRATDDDPAIDASFGLSFAVAASIVCVAPVVAQQVECSTESGLTAVAHAAPMKLRFRNHFHPAARALLD